MVRAPLRTDALAVESPSTPPAQPTSRRDRDRDRGRRLLMATKLRAAKAATPTRPANEPPRPGTAYPVRRRPKQIAAGAALMVVCALLAAVLFNQAGSR